jgi:hypothetical protein
LVHLDSEGQGSYLGVQRPIDGKELRDGHLMPGFHLWPFHVRGKEEPPPIQHHLVVEGSEHQP